MKNIAVLINVGSRREAGIIARALVGKKLAACVNIFPFIESVYTWKGKTEVSKEMLLVAKTRASLFPKVEKMVKRLHSYECPEIIAVPVVKGSRSYLRWIEESTL